MADDFKFGAIADESQINIGRGDVLEDLAEDIPLKYSTFLINKKTGVITPAQGVIDTRPTIIDTSSRYHEEVKNPEYMRFVSGNGYESSLMSNYHDTLPEEYTYLLKVVEQINAKHFVEYDPQQRPGFLNKPVKELLNKDPSEWFRGYVKPVQTQTKNNK